MRPSFPFYPDDWLNDLALRGCSPLSRAVWIDLICLMHQGTPYGHLADKAGALSPRFIAGRCGVTGKQLSIAMKELECRGVFSRSERPTLEGILFSRRMVRDEYRRVVRGAGGHASLTNPSVPRPKKDTLHGYLYSDAAKDTFHPEEVKSIAFKSSSSRGKPLCAPEVFDPIPGWMPFKLSYPSHRINEYMDFGIWIEVVDSAETQKLVMDRLKEYKASKQWKNPQMVPKASTWLGERQFRTPACPDEDALVVARPRLML